MTLDSSRRHSYKKGSSSQPHIIDSSKVSSNLTTKSDTPPESDTPPKVGDSSPVPERPK